MHTLVGPWHILIYWIEVIDNLHIPTMRTIAETAEIFHLPVHFVRQKVNSGEVVAVRAGKKFLVNVEKFAEFLNGELSPMPLHLAEKQGESAAYSAKITPIPRDL